MKTKVKILFAAILFVGMAGSAFAQTSADATTSATVQTALSISSSADVEFGTVSVSTTPSINASTGVTEYCGSGANLGKFTVAGSGGASVNVTFSDDDLKATVEAVEYTISFSPSVYRTAVTAATDGETSVSSGSDYTVNNTAEGGKVIGTDHFFVGGTLSVGDIVANPAATYTGTFTMTVAYN